MPDYFGVDQLPRLDRFLHFWSSELPLAVELRNRDFFKNADTQSKLFELLEKHGVSAVTTDVAGCRDLLHQHISNHTAMVRWVGNNLHPTDFQRIDEWVKLFEKWRKSGVNQIYFFTHEPENLLVPEICDYLISHVKNAMPKAIIKNLQWRSD